MPVAYGWSASDAALIAEIGLAFGIAPGNRYLWDFATLPAWRGRGIYPRLLQAILGQETGEVDRFWIGHLPMNHSSARGIQAAGFRCVGTIHASSERRPALVPAGTATRAPVTTALLNTPFPSTGHYAA
jgi:GNAT superfamily N-acetyltransferase